MSKIGQWRHICVDVQRMFAEDTPWFVPWMHRVMPQLEEISRSHAERTIFTRFIPPASAADTIGAWRDYYEKWRAMTGEHLPQGMTGLVSSLERFVPPARVFEKSTYSPWIDGRLFAHLREDHVSTVVVTGGETDVCVLATVLGAIDLGFHVIVLSDAVCSGANGTHDAATHLLAERFSVQLTMMTTEKFLSSV
jgi:nicotinamidase-related amidase